MKSAQYIARIALIAFLFNALLPFFATYNVPAHAAGNKQLASMFGEKILICTGDGFKWVSWKELQNEKPHDAPDHAKCPLCYIAAHGLSVITPDQPVLAAPMHQSIAYTAYRYQPAALSLASALGSRAPPSFFS